MKYDVTQELMLFNGQTAKMNDGEVQRDMTLRDAIEIACLNAPNDIVKTGEQKHKLFQVLDRVHSAEDVTELSAEEVTLVKRVAGELFTVALVGAVYKALESAAG